mgnify:CR=1 FL=1
MSKSDHLILLRCVGEGGGLIGGGRILMKKDFVTWLRMFLVFMVAGGITIQAVLYPNYYPLEEGIIMAFSRAFFGMFLTKIDDLDSQYLTLSCRWI